VPEWAVESLERYVALLAKWNGKINLTALPLNPPTSETFDRLLVEPLAAARRVPGKHLIWMDLGTGGGSPALPLKVVRPAAALTMVEAKARKAAFLREAVRALGFSDAVVENERIEATAETRPSTAELVTVRAVKLDKALIFAARRLLATDGQLLLFGPEPRSATVSGFDYRDTLELVPDRRAYVSTYVRLNHSDASN
jgi:16S rRNA (guanine527-N7)-methyltransferase